MNTLSKAYTRFFFESASDYAALESQWSELVNSDECKTLGPEHYLLYALLRGKDYRKGFTPVTNTRKLENGGFYGWRLIHALRIVVGVSGPEATTKLLRPFAGLVSEAMLAQVRKVLPVQRYWIEPADLKHVYVVPPEMLTQPDTAHSEA